jgi:hypothetical protein
MKTKDYKHTIETKNFISNSKLKAVSQYDKNNNFIKNWDSAKNAGKELKICSQNISNCCKERLKSAGGFIWRYNY